jgi:hypothetical protein
MNALGAMPAGPRSELHLHRAHARRGEILARFRAGDYPAARDVVADRGGAHRARWGCWGQAASGGFSSVSSLRVVPSGVRGGSISLWTTGSRSSRAHAGLGRMTRASRRSGSQVVPRRIGALGEPIPSLTKEYRLL